VKPLEELPLAIDGSVELFDLFRGQVKGAHGLNLYRTSGGDASV